MFKLKPESSLDGGSEPARCPLPRTRRQEQQALGQEAAVRLCPVLKALWVSVVGKRSFPGYPPTERRVKTEGREGLGGSRASKVMCESVPRKVGMLGSLMIPRWVRKWQSGENK